MSNNMKDSWRETGSGLGHAFKDLGKTLIKTGKTGVDKAVDWAEADDAPRQNYNTPPQPQQPYTQTPQQPYGQPQSYGQQQFVRQPSYQQPPQPAPVNPFQGQQPNTQPQYQPPQQNPAAQPGQQYMYQPPQPAQPQPNAYVPPVRQESDQNKK